MERLQKPATNLVCHVKPSNSMLKPLHEFKVVLESFCSNLQVGCIE